MPLINKWRYFYPHEPDSRYSGAIRVLRRHGGALRTKQVLALGIHPATLYKFRDSGRVIELARGFYRLAQSDECENPDLAVVAARAPDG